MLDHVQKGKVTICMVAAPHVVLFYNPDDMSALRVTSHMSHGP